MEEIIKLPKYTLSFKQSAKGEWYCDEAKVRSEGIDDLRSCVEAMLIIAKSRLAELKQQGS